MADSAAGSRVLDLEALTLLRGGHEENTEFHMCVMEAAAYIAGEPWSDHPSCASPVIGAFLRSWNDRLDDEGRQSLKRYIERLVGSKGTDAQERQRAWMATDWLIREQTPRWLRLADMDEEADLLAGLTEIGPDTVPGIRATLEAVRRESWARRARWRDELKARFVEAYNAKLEELRAAVVAEVAVAAVVAEAAGVDLSVGSELWWKIRDAAYTAARDAIVPKVREVMAPHRDEFMDSAHDLVDRMLEVTGS